MSDNKKYYYLRLKENFYDSDSMIVLESMQDGYLYSNILLKLYLRSLKNEGKLMFNEKIPYNSTMLANITRHQVGTVEKAVKVFEDLGLIEILDNGAIYISEIQDFIGKTTTEADRKRVYRKQIDDDKLALNGQMSRQISDKSMDKSPPELELELDLDLELDLEKDIEKDINKKSVPAKKKKETKRKYGEYKRVLLTDKQFEKLKAEHNNYEELIKNLDEYIEMKGKYKVENHLLAINRWVVNAVKEQEQRNNKNQNAKTTSNNIFHEIGKEEGLW